MGSVVASGPSAAGRDGTVLEGRQSYLVDELLEHQGSVDVMALSEDESVLVTGSDDRTLRMWSVKTGLLCQCLGILSGHEGYVTSVALEGLYVLSGSADATVRKWDMGTCECVTVFRGHASKVNRVICTGELVLSCSSDRTVRCWDLDVGTCLQVFRGHGNSVLTIAFVPERTSDVDGFNTTVTSSGAEYRLGDVMVSGSTDGTARAWSFVSGSTVAVFRGHKGVVTCLGIDPEGKVLVTGSTDATVRTWVLKTGQNLKVLQGHTASIICLTVFNRLIFTGSSDTTARLWSMDGGLQETVFKGHAHTILCIRQRNGIVMTGGSDGTVICFEAKTGNIKRTFKGSTGAIVNYTQVVGMRLFVCSTDGTLRIWDLNGILGIPEDKDNKIKMLQ